jgi:hypothetical protein
MPDRGLTLNLTNQLRTDLVKLRLQYRAYFFKIAEGVFSILGTLRSYIDLNPCFKNLFIDF